MIWEATANFIIELEERNALFSKVCLLMVDKVDFREAIKFHRRTMYYLKRMRVALEMKDSREMRKVFDQFRRYLERTRKRVLDVEE